MKKKWEPTLLTKEASEKAKAIKLKNNRKDRVVTGHGYKTSSVFKSHQTSSFAWKVEKVKNMLDGLGDEDMHILKQIEELIKNKNDGNASDGSRGKADNEKHSNGNENEINEDDPWS